MAIVEQVERGVGDQASHDLRVDQWHDWIVTAGEDQRRLAQLM